MTCTCNGKQQTEDYDFRELSGLTKEEIELFLNDDRLEIVGRAYAPSRRGRHYSLRFRVKKTAIQKFKLKEMWAVWLSFPGDKNRIEKTGPYIERPVFKDKTHVLAITRADAVEFTIGEGL